mmetsp:Transcript_20383/g.56645  ORF Transcript_20383/g.56645 Transcript_20383/m.56645 type:complete len:227 (-) Transcript_20383:84-764(-)|eukprot:CAMPEP_0117545506 /NCGR_PEP_ID=MMETSP0784-20121206/46128_1 /TAXON_ID=39447 /ORGANISM="" /LENGTH=226 /DNA_ID=CAMNT_0005342351 /DNA_START=58 /DNA_END=738 /DNA_ORIENTATION=+
MFKARAPPKNRRRQTEEPEAGEVVVDSDEEDNDETATKLAEIREIQREQWSRPRGVPPMPTIKSKEQEEEEEEDDQWGLDTGFAGGTTTQKSDPHLEAFLNERLYAKKEEEGVKEKTREDRLYEVPDDLQVPDAAVEVADKMSWMAGLAEVPLGVEYKLANIEATEKAKRDFLHGDNAPHRGAVLETDAVTRKAFGSRFMQYNDKGDSKSATDDAALDRFRKRLRR